MFVDGFYSFAKLALQRRIAVRGHKSDMWVIFFGIKVLRSVLLVFPLSCGKRPDAFL